MFWYWVIKSLPQCPIRLSPGKNSSEPWSNIYYVGLLQLIYAETLVKVAYNLFEPSGSVPLVKPVLWETTLK